MLRCHFLIENIAHLPFVLIIHLMCIFGMPYTCTCMCIHVLQDMLQDVSDHEPEFTSLKREVGILCEGPAPEAVYWEKVSPLSAPGCPLGSQQARPGQADQNAIIQDYEERLEALKKLMQGRVQELNIQLEKGREFESKTEELSLWLGECAQKLAGLRIRDPKSSTISCQLLDCQVTLLGGYRDS